MAKVFISYSRKDIEFAKKLTGELAKSDLDFWVDWEGIPPTVDWWRQIEIGIEEADTFIFLISPDSAASKVCGQEIDCAIKNGKRLIPLVVREVKGDESPKQLGHLNWIFFRESDDFDAAIKKLLTSIQTDYEWVQVHRELQVKALEWERGKRDKSFLLRGKDLQDAEAQLAANTSKEPHPTDLQRDFIFQSRQAVDRQRRVMTGISAVAVIVMAVLAVYGLVNAKLATDNEATALANLSSAQTAQVEAVVARETAVANEALAQAAEDRAVNAQETAEANAAEAERQAKIALSRQLVSQAQNLPESEIDTALLLALAGLKNLDTTSGRLTMMRLLDSQPNLVGMMRAYPTNIDALAFSPDGKFLASLGCSELADELDHGWTCPGYDVRLWDVASHKLVGAPFRWQPPDTYIEEFDERADQIALSRKGMSVAIINHSAQTVEFWDPATGEWTHSLPPAEYIQMVFGPDGKSFATLELNGTLTLWDWPSLQQPQVLASGGSLGEWSIIRYSPDGSLLASSSFSSIQIWETLTGARLAEMTFPTEGFGGNLPFIGGMTFTADGRSLAAFAQIMDTSPENMPTVEFTYFDYYDDGFTLNYVARTELAIWDLNTFAVQSEVVDDETANASHINSFLTPDLRFLPGEDLLAAQEYSPDGKMQASVECRRGGWLECIGGVIKLYSVDPAPRGIAYLDLVPVPGFSPSGLFSFTADGSRVGLVDEDAGKLAYFDAATGELDSMISNVFGPDGGAPGLLSNLSLAGDVAVARADGFIHLLNFANASGGPILQPAQPDGILQEMVLSSDGRTLMLLLNVLGCCSYAVEVWDTQKPELIISVPVEISTFEGEDVSSDHYTMSSDGHYFASTDGITIDLWDLHEARQLPSLPAPQGRTRAIALSTDGRLAIPLPNQLIVLDIHSGARLADISWSASVIVSVFFGQDSGNLFAVIENQEYYGNPYAGLQRPEQHLLWDLVGIRDLWFPPLTDVLMQSPDGRQLLMRDGYGNLFTLQTNYEGWQQQVCLIANRNLTPSEWTQYIGDILPYQALCPDLPLAPFEAAAP